MIDTIKTVVGLMFGKSAPMAWTAIGFAGCIGYAGFLYLMNEQMKVELEQKEVVIGSFQKAIEESNEAIKNLDHELQKTIERYEEARDRRDKLESDLEQVRKEYAESTRVFDKERGRFQRLFEKKAVIITNRANAATKRLFREIERQTEAGNDQDGL